MKHPVLLYHHVTPHPGNKWSISPAGFRRQIAWLLDTGFEILTLRDFFGEGPAKKAFVTFDDGYDTVYEHAFPVLRELGVAASVFLITDYIGGTNVWDHSTIPRSKHLTPWQILELRNNQWEMHSHTASHANFCQLAAHEIAKDVRCATQTIRRWNDGLLFCAFPHGRSEPRLTSALIENGYAGAFVAEPFWSDSNRFRLPRIPIAGEACRAFKAWLVGSET